MRRRIKQFFLWIKKKWKFWLGFLGIILTIIGWFISSTDQRPWLQRIIAPDFFAFNKNYHKIQNPGFILRPTDNNFEAIAKILKSQIDQSNKPGILEIKTIHWGTGFGTDKFKSQQGPFIEFDVQFHTGQKLQMIVWDLEKKITQEFEKNINKWSSMIFWLGIVLSFLTILKE